MFQRRSATGDLNDRTFIEKKSLCFKREKNTYYLRNVSEITVSIMKMLECGIEKLHMAEM